MYNAIHDVAADYLKCFLPHGKEIEIDGKVRRFVPQTQMLKDVAAFTGYPRESVRGSVCKDDNQGLFSIEKQNYYNGFPVKKNRLHPAGFILRESGESFRVSNQNYNCSMKAAIREKFLDYVEERYETGKMITFPHVKGYCVQAILKRFPSASITAVEEKAEVFDLYLLNNFPTNNYHWKFCDVIDKVRDQKFDFINLDCHTYLSREMFCDLRNINESKMTSVLAVTMLKHENFRNHGNFVDLMKRKYLLNPEPVHAALRDVLSNYDEVFYDEYKKTNTDNPRKMCSYVFVRKDQ